MIKGEGLVTLFLVFLLLTLNWLDTIFYGAIANELKLVN